MTTGLAINGTVFNTPLQEYFVNHTLASKALLSDVEYYVTVQAYTPYNFNNATNTSSNGIKVRACRAASKGRKLDETRSGQTSKLDHSAHHAAQLCSSCIHTRLAIHKP